MNTKLIIAATVAALSLATTAFAAEGNGNPFPFRAPGETTYTTQAVRDTGTSQYPYANPALSVPSLAQATLPENGAQGSVETANSLPVATRASACFDTPSGRLSMRTLGDTDAPLPEPAATVQGFRRTEWVGEADQAALFLL